jgi:ubiquinone/menaquinone biosynthesis C-methylase UbiE
VTESAQELNPQALQMADTVIAGTLEAQTQAIWPQELPLLQRYRIPSDAQILDAGCGTGEAAHRLAIHWPRATVLGIDVAEPSLDRARSRFGALAPRLSFESRSVFGLQLPSHSFDLTVCRHVLHSIPQPSRVIAELVRVTRPGGYLHLIVEDYGMIHFERADAPLQEFWRVVSDRYRAAQRTEMRLGRSIARMLCAQGLLDIALDYMVVDTLRVPRNTFARIMQGWRDGFAKLTSDLTAIAESKVIATFDQMIEQILDPQGYVLWLVPVASARIPHYPSPQLLTR